MVEEPIHRNPRNTLHAQKLKDQASVWKQERLFNQERRLQRGHRRWEEDVDSDDDDAKGGGKWKKLKKKGDKK